MNSGKIEKLQRILIQIYLILLCGGLPLFYVRTYAGIGTWKWRYYCAVTLGFRSGFLFVPGIILVMTGLHFLLVVQKGKMRRMENPFLAGYLMIACLSAWMADDRVIALQGYPGWYMGLKAQISFVLVYVMIRTYWQPDRRLLRLNGVVSSAVFALEILNRFWLYPFGIAAGFGRDVLINFVSTIGNINWFAGYAICMVPLAFGVFLQAEDTLSRRLAGLWVSLTAMMTVTLNSESLICAFFAVCAVFVFLCPDERPKLMRLVRMFFLIAASWLVIGLAYRLFKGHVVPLGRLSRGLMNPLLNVVLLAGFTVMERRMSNPVTAVSWTTGQKKRAVLVLAGLAVMMMIGLRLAGSRYLVWNDRWGNHRGLLWRLTAETWKELLRDAPLQALLGCGPDQYAAVLQKYRAEQLRTVFYTQAVTNAHNEFLTALINYGLSGLICYAGIWGCEIRRLVHAMPQQPWLATGIACMIGYMVNAFFTFQQIAAVPFIFTLMAVFAVRAEEMHHSN